MYPHRELHGFCPQWLCIFIPRRICTVSPHREFHGFCPQWLCIFIPQRIYTLSLQGELSWTLPSVASYFHPSEDLHRVSSERIITDFALSGFVFSSLRGFIPCLLRENFHGFCPQWLCIFIPQRIYTVSSPRELSRILPSVAFRFHPLED